MEFKEAMQNLKEKFTSGNDIPVTRNTILKEEYEAIKNHEPGLICPTCKFLIKFSIEDLLYKSEFVCPGCGLVLKLNREGREDFEESITNKAARAYDEKTKE